MRSLSAHALAGGGWARLSLLLTISVAACGRSEPAADAVSSGSTGASTALTDVDVTCAGDQHRRVKVGDRWLRWDQQSWCLSSPASGTFRSTIRVTNPPNAPETVRIGTVELVKITPRPAHEAFEQTVGPLAEALTFERGVGATLAPGDSVDLVVRSRYMLDSDHEGARANFHLSFALLGDGDSADRFVTTVHVSAGKAPDGGGGPKGGEPPGKRRERRGRPAGPRRGER